MNMSRIEHELYELERRAYRLSLAMQAESLAIRDHHQATSRLVQAQAYSSIGSTMFGRNSATVRYPITVRVLGCNAHPRRGATVRYTSRGAIAYEVTQLTDGDGYSYWGPNNNTVAHVVSVDAQDGYASFDVGGTGTLFYGGNGPTTAQTVADLDHVCLANCLSPALVAGQTVTLGGIGTSTTLLKGLAANTFYADFDVSSGNVRDGQNTSGSSYRVSAVKSGTTRVRVNVSRHGSTGHVAIQSTYSVFGEPFPGTGYAMVGDRFASVPSGPTWDLYNLVPVSNVSVSTYTCGDLEMTLDTTATGLYTDLSIESISIG